MRITLEGDQLFFEVNGQVVKAENVKFLSPENLKEVCGEARRLLADGTIRFIRLEGSIRPPDRVKRRFELATRKFRRSEAMLSEF